MGGITDEHVEWAVVNRLSKMLEDPPETKYNVTLSFALFNTILLWTKNRVWVAGNNGQNQDLPHQSDKNAHVVREQLQKTKIVDEPWQLSRNRPSIEMGAHSADIPDYDPEINKDFVEFSAAKFFRWLRNAIAHGDGRNIRPIHKNSAQSNKTFLAGFKIEFEQQSTAQVLILDLYISDIIRIGGNLADLFCRSFSGGDHYFEEEADTALIEEVTNLAQ